MTNGKMMRISAKKKTKMIPLYYRLSIKLVHIIKAEVFVFKSSLVALIIFCILAICNLFEIFLETLDLIVLIITQNVYKLISFSVMGVGLVNLRAPTNTCTG